MGLFGKLVATTINVATLPVAAVKDAITLGNCANSQEDSYIMQKLKQIKEEAE